MSEISFQHNVIIEAELINETGMRIGGSKETLEIGGVDAPVMRDPITKLPYLPGSSIKGKIRSLLELSGAAGYPGNADRNKPCRCGKCGVCYLFGIPAEESTPKGPSRLVIRDAFPTDQTIQDWEVNGSIDGTETKPEVAINRLTSESHFRGGMERVVRGSHFGVEMVYSIYEPGDVDRFKILVQGMAMLEDNYLGGSGTRGYGKVVFKNLKLTKRALNYYQQEGDEEPLGEFESLAALQESLDSLLSKLQG